MNQDQQQDGAELQQQQPRHGKVQLGEFWPQAPNAWFSAAELKFEVAKHHQQEGALRLRCWSHGLQCAHPGKKARLALSVDASGTHVGAALQQEVSSGNLQPLGFFSRKLNTAEQKYSAYDRELLTVYAVIKHFRWALEGRGFYVLSDHKPLTFTLHKQSDA